MRALAKARTLWRLGPVNVLRVATYRALVRIGWYERVLPIAAPLPGPFIDWSAAGAAPSFPEGADAAGWSASAERVIAGELPVFSHRWVDTGFPPRWQRSVITGIDSRVGAVHWSRIGNFDLPGGDVKGYWEPSRFDGLLVLTLGWLCSRRADIRAAIDRWLESWCADNPANAGLQWNCGQETAIRLMQLLLAVELLQRWSAAVPTAALIDLVAQHCGRIAPTMLYAIGQDNNHGSSEAAALFIGGGFLAARAPPALALRGERWRATGRRWLEDRISRLVLPDGSFAQHSVNYHRMLLDTCALAETFRRWRGDAPFSALARERCRAATEWLAALTDAESGDAPNLGANDGARLFVLHRLAYRDFRPTLRWASRLFAPQQVAPAVGDDERSAWLQLDTTPASAASGAVDATPASAASGAVEAAPSSGDVRLWPDGGYATLGAPGAWALLRLPRYRFRPSHADALHLDLWIDGVDALCDGGSYRYNTEARWLRYFSGTESHNTVQFDDRDQMPRVSRFLFGDWLDCEELHVDAATATVVAAYRDAFGARHRRSVTLNRGRCSVVDEVSGFHAKAVLRWRLAPSLRGRLGEGAEWTDGAFKIRVRSTGPIARVECVEGWQSRHYADKTALPVLEVEVHSGSTLTTDITWPA